MTTSGSAPSGTPPAALVIFNPVSATFDAAAFDAALAAAFDPAGGPCLRFETDARDDCAARMAGAIEDAVRAGCPLVVAAGGDGTVSAVVNAMVGVDAADRPVVAILPLGTANVLARELEIPIDPARAALLAAGRAKVVDLDAIQIGERFYLTQLGVGLDAKMIEGTTREEQKSSGRLAYMRALVREMFGHRSHGFELTIDGRRYRKRAWQVVVANAKTMGTPPFTWGPDIEPTDGVLNVGVYNVRGVGDWLLLVLRFLTRRHQVDRRARYFEVRETLRIATQSPLPVQADGDVIGDTPVDVRVAPALFRVVVGPEDPAAAADPAAAPAQAPPAIEAPPGAVVTAAADAAQAVRLTLWKRLAGVDHAVYLWINRLQAWGPATRVARIVSRTMDHGELWVGVAILAAAFDPESSWLEMLGVVAVLWLAELTVNFPIKSAFRRRRPYDRFTQAAPRVTNLPRDWSFPSGHSATAFAGALLLTAFLPGLSPLFFAYAGIVALSRVYLGVHYPVDVVLGGAVGMGLAVVYGAILQGIVSVF